MKSKTAVSQANLLKWLTDPRLDAYLGRTAAIRLSVLGWHLTGRRRTLSAIAKRHGVTRAALTKHARRVGQIFGPCKP
jgi:hypothetical protein